MHMKQWFKVLSGLLIALVAVGAVTALVIKYLDVLVRGFDTLRGHVERQKARFFSKSNYCDCDDDEVCECE